MTTPLADPEDLRIQVNLREIHVERAAQLIAAASDLVKAYCRGRQFVRVEGDEVTLDGKGGTILLTPDYPVEAVASVVVEGEPLSYPDDFSWSRRGTLRRHGACWPDAYRSVVVTYTHGPAEGEILADVRGVVLAIAGRAYTFRTDIPDSIGDEPLSEASGFSPDALMLPSERRVLDAHRDVLV